MDAANMRKVYEKWVPNDPKGKTKYDLAFDMIYFANHIFEIIKNIPIRISKKMSAAAGYPEGMKKWIVHENEDEHNTRHDSVLKSMTIDSKNTVKALAARMYNKQKEKNIQREHGKMPYSKDQFIEWLYNNPEFKERYISWVFSKFRSEFRPSIDRIDSGKGYEFCNIRVLNWGENESINIICKKISKSENNDEYWSEKIPVSQLAYYKVLKSNIKILVPARNLVDLLG
jgi:hypothetical protein